MSNVSKIFCPHGDLVVVKRDKNKTFKLIKEYVIEKCAVKTIKQEKRIRSVPEESVGIFKGWSEKDSLKK